MSGKNISFNNKNIRKSTFYENKTINNIEGIDVNNILASNNETESDIDIDNNDE